MIGKIVSFVALLSVVLAASRTWEEYRPFEGIDPNTLSCDPRGEEFLLLPHFTNCSQYYMCAHGAEVEFSCAPGGLRFDFELQTCNWAYATPCVLRDIIEEGSGDETEFSLFASKNAGAHLTAEVSGTVRPVAAVSARETNNAVPLNCRDADIAARHVPYKGDCQRYWRCEAGVPQTFYCSDGLFFNEATQQCDHEANVKCSVEMIEEIGEEFLAYN